MEASNRGGDDGSCEADDAESFSNKKTERKRMREKERRQEEKRAFEELSQLVAEFAPGHQGGQGHEHAGIDASDLTRIDLISKSCDIIQRLHAENTAMRRSTYSGNKDVSHSLSSWILFAIGPGALSCHTQRQLSPHNRRLWC